MISEDPSFLSTITSNTKYFREKMSAAGFTVSGDNHPICPVMLGDAKLASTFANKMLGTFFSRNSCFENALLK